MKEGKDKNHHQNNIPKLGAVWVVGMYGMVVLLVAVGGRGGRTDPEAGGNGQRPFLSARRFISLVHARMCHNINMYRNTISKITMCAFLSPWFGWNTILGERQIEHRSLLPLESTHHNTFRSSPAISPLHHHVSTRRRLSPGKCLHDPLGRIRQLHRERSRHAR